MDTPQNDRLLSRKQIAKGLKVSVRTLSRIRKERSDFPKPDRKKGRKDQFWFLRPFRKWAVAGGFFFCDPDED
jgi:hypothetical protein